MIVRSYCPRCERAVYSDTVEARCPVCYSMLEEAVEEKSDPVPGAEAAAGLEAVPGAEEVA